MARLTNMCIIVAFLPISIKVKHLVLSCMILAQYDVGDSQFYMSCQHSSYRKPTKWKEDILYVHHK